MNTVYVQLGSNLWDRENLIYDAVQQISNLVGNVIVQSKIYESMPWRVEGQENYLNQIIQVTTSLSPDETMLVLLKIENDLGRVRVEKWGERLIDLDIIFFNNEIIETPDLCVPHKHMHQRNFVLMPLNEIASGFIHPKYKKSVSQLFKESKDTEKVEEYAS